MNKIKIIIIVKQKERQILQDIINLKTKLELFDENKSLVKT